MIQCVHLVLLVATIGTASWPPGAMAVNVLVASEMVQNMTLYSPQYLNVSTGFYLVMQPDLNLILYNRSQPLMITNFTYNDATDNGFANASIYTTIIARGLTFYSDTLESSGSIFLSVEVWGESSSGGMEIAMTQSIWTYSWGAGTTRPLYPYMILRANGSCDFFDFYGNQLRGTGMNKGPFLIPYTAPVGLTTAPSPAQLAPSASGNQTNITVAPNITYPFPPEFAWNPPSSLDGFPYMPAGYFLSQGSALLSLDQKFTLTVGSDCNLQVKVSDSNGTEGALVWESGSSIVGPGLQASSCQLMLQQDGLLVIRNNLSTIYWNSSATGNDSGVTWVLILSSTDGILNISDLENSTNVLWSTYVRPDQTKRTTMLVAVGVSVGVSVVATAGFVLLYFYTQTNILDPSEKAFRQRLKENGGMSQTRFSQAKIKQATKNFGTSIGSGGFGNVYYGKLPDGQEIAAKVLSAESHQSKQEFYNEIELLSVVHHKSLVSLLGYRCGRDQQILVYEYMRGGDLRDRLQGQGAVVNPLSWRQRTSIALQVAEGLEYLHDKCCPSIIHRDVKSTNILLTDTLVAKVADFGLSKLRSREQEAATHVTTVVKGTPGYLDPEYHETGMLTDKSDVYAFGIVLMEILTGQQQMYIAHRVAEAWRLGRLDELPDPNLKGEYEGEEFGSLVELALWCVRKVIGERPFMRQVVQRLREMGSAPLEPMEGELILGDEGQLVVALDLELDNSQDFARHTVPLSGSLSSDFSSEFWRSEAGR